MVWGKGHVLLVRMVSLPTPLSTCSTNHIFEVGRSQAHFRLASRLAPFTTFWVVTGDRIS